MSWMASLDLTGSISSADKSSFFFFNDTATTEIYTLSLHDALPISVAVDGRGEAARRSGAAEERAACPADRSEEHTSELQSPDHLVCRLLLEKKKKRCNCRSTSCTSKYRKGVAASVWTDHLHRHVRD